MCGAPASVQQPFRNGANVVPSFNVALITMADTSQQVAQVEQSRLMTHRGGAWVPDAMATRRALPDSTGPLFETRRQERCTEGTSMRWAGWARRREK